MKHFILLIIFIGSSVRQVLAQQPALNDYEPGVLIFKLSESNRDLAGISGSSQGRLQQLIEGCGGGTLRKNFPAAKPPGKKSFANAKNPVDLSRIYELKLKHSGYSIDSLCLVFMKSGLFNWVQPRYVQYPMFTPNDPQVTQQYHHNLIKTFEAWDITTGDTNTVIGITDAGIQFDHNDLQNIKFNYNDPINGLDDDLDGYTDNFRGWNAVNNSNDPTATLSPHGIFTTGMSSATVNNGIGVAGVAFRCKFIPVRIDNSSGFNYGYEGIVYAADMGCQVINASWGRTRTSPMGAEVIRYAQERNCLVVAAAGNSALNEKYYPASYPGVLSVGASGQTDLKWSGSTFGPRIDLIAPGENVRSTWPFNGYDNSSGTSFSAPLAAGAAALVKSKFPTYNALQLAERLKVTADTSIYQLPGNAAWLHLMGAGRLNIFRALNDPEKPSVHFTMHSFTDNDGDQFAEPGDEITLSGTFKNFLGSTKNLKVLMTCASPFVKMLDSTFTAGLIAGGDSLVNSSRPFRLLIKQGAPYNLDLLLKITYSDTGYRAFEYIEFRVNKDYMDMDVNNILTTISSRGNIGYAADYATDGSGWMFQGQQLIFYSGLMLGTSGQKIANNAYAAKLPGFDNDFVRKTGVQSDYIPGLLRKEIKAEFYTDSAAAEKVLVKHRALAVKGQGIDDQVLLHYTLINQGNTPIDGLHSGIFTDFNIRDANQNGSGFVTDSKLIYAFDTGSGGIYAGIRQLSRQSAHGYAFNSDGAGGSINLTDGFSDAEKFQALSGSLQRNASQPGDVASLIGSGAITLAPGDSVDVAYAMLCARSLNSLIENSLKAQGFYNFSEMEVYQSTLPLTCDQLTGTVQLNFRTTGNLTIRLLNSDGVTLNTSSGALSSYAYQGLTAGHYFIRYEFQDQSTWETGFKLDELLPVKATAEANPAITTLTSPDVQFSATAIHATTFNWDFGDGSVSAAQNPLHTYSDTGTFSVRVVASNAWCADTVYLQVIVGTTVGLDAQQHEPLIFPVPAVNELRVQLPYPLSTVSYRLYSLSGTLLVSGKIAEKQPVNLQNIPSGTYLLHMQLPDKNLIKVFPVIK
jgi:hypothetical protein